MYQLGQIIKEGWGDMHKRIGLSPWARAGLPVAAEQLLESRCRAENLYVSTIRRAGSSRWVAKAFGADHYNGPVERYEAAKVEDAIEGAIERYLAKHRFTSDELAQIQRQSV